jgi:VanZ family protein
MWVPPFGLLSMVPYADKPLHALAFGLLTYVFSKLFSIRKSVLIVLLVSVFLELSQYFIPYRGVQLSDGISNIAGIIVAWGWCHIRDHFKSSISILTGE